MQGSPSELQRIQLFLSTDATQVLVKSLACLSLHIIQPLQLIQNILNIPMFSHTTPWLRSLHWLPVADHSTFKTLIFAYKAKIDQHPPTLKHTYLIKPRTAPCSHWSTSTAQLGPSSLRVQGRLQGIETFLRPGTQVVEWTSNRSPNSKVCLQVTTEDLTLHQELKFALCYLVCFSYCANLQHRDFRLMTLLVPDLMNRY